MSALVVRAGGTERERDAHLRRARYWGDTRGWWCGRRARRHLRHAHRADNEVVAARVLQRLETHALRDTRIAETPAALHLRTIYSLTTSVALNDALAARSASARSRHRNASATCFRALRCAWRRTNKLLCEGTGSQRAWH